MPVTAINCLHAGKPTHYWRAKAEPEKLNTALPSQAIIKKDRESHESEWRLPRTRLEAEHRHPDAAEFSRCTKVKDHENIENSVLVL